MGRKPIEDSKLKVKSTPVYINDINKKLIINEHGSFKNWVLYEVKRLQKKVSKKVA